MRNTGSGENASMKHVLDAISALSIKIDTISDQHRSLEQLACEDSKVRKSVQEIRKASNIIELNNATQLLEWYYDEITNAPSCDVYPVLNFTWSPDRLFLLERRSEHNSC